jgi:hypothetical protein
LATYPFLCPHHNSPISISITVRLSTCPPVHIFDNLKSSSLFVRSTKRCGARALVDRRMHPHWARLMYLYLLVPYKSTGEGDLN